MLTKHFLFSEMVVFGGDSEPVFLMFSSMLTKLKRKSVLFAIAQRIIQMAETCRRLSHAEWSTFTIGKLYSSKLRFSPKMYSSPLYCLHQVHRSSALFHPVDNRWSRTIFLKPYSAGSSLEITREFRKTYVLLKKFI